MSERLLQWAPSPATLKLTQLGWGVFATVLLAIFLVKVTKRSLNYPPGPPRDFILGNARQMTGDHVELKLTEWGKRYGISRTLRQSQSFGLTQHQRLDVDLAIGDVNYLEVLGQPLVVLNSYSACKDLLEKRSSIYSSRPRLVLLSEL